MFRKFLIVFTVLLVSVAVVSCGGKSEKAKSSAGSSYSGTAGTGAEVFDISGKLRNLNEWVGKKPVVLNFWGTWCPPCRREIPDLVRLYEEYSPKGVEMLGLAVNDKPEKVRSFSEQNGMKWVMLMATRDAITKYVTQPSIPQTIFLDKNGNVVARFTGAQTYNTFKKAFEALLQDKS